MSSPSLSVAIPTYQRETVLIDTLRALLALLRADDELLIVDQTEHHQPETENALREMQGAGRLVWIRLTEASVTKAMNVALLRARRDFILFLDDDIKPDAGLLEAHRAGHRQAGGQATIIAGRVIQPWQEGVDYSGDTHFHFASLTSREATEFMGGNFSLRRAEALRLGGFDANFVRVAYRFEAEFARRWRNSGRRIRYEPAAVIHHLKVSSGGTRTFGRHLTTFRPDHAVGAYYYFLRTQNGTVRARSVLFRLLQSAATRHHLRKPWWIPATWLAEVLGLLWALKLNHRGPALLDMPVGTAVSEPYQC